MTWLTRVLRGRGPRAEVVVLTRRGCHLCDEMEQVVAGVVPPGQVSLVDLDDAGREDPALLERYDTAVPVLLVDGVEVARWQVDAATVRTAVRRRGAPRG